MQEKEHIISTNHSLTSQPLGLYLHVPFCASTCDFCAFYQEKPKRPDIERYLQGIEQELKQLQLKRPINTIFFGGGTPGLLPADDLLHLGQLLHKYCNLSHLQEWTLEMAPSTVKSDKIKALLDIGVTRISIGVQSFKEPLLQQLGRLHSPKQIYQAYDILRSHNFPNINLDLIFAIPNQTMDDWLEDLHEAIQLNPTHLSTYCLTFEEDTALYIKLSQGKVKINIDHEAELFQKTWEYLDTQGFKQYEISNFSRPGYECLHNINTWRMFEWVGIGPSASSQYQGKRYTHPHNLDQWLKGLTHHPEKNPLLIDTLDLSDSLLAVDSLIFGLRMNRGVNLAELQSRFPSFDYSKYNDLFETWQSTGLVEYRHPFLKPTSHGRLLADRLAVEVME